MAAGGIAPPASRAHAADRLREAARERLRSRLWLLVPAAALNGALFLLPLYLVAENSLEGGLGGYREVFESPLLEPVVTNTVVISSITTVVAVVLAYLCALAAWRAGPVLRAVILGCVLLPFWTGVLVKNFAWAALLQDNGVVNDFLRAVGVADQPVTLLHTRLAVIIGMVHYVLPYAVFPIFAVMIALDRRLEDAAASLGASRVQIARHVLLPLTRPGVLAAGLLAFIISVGFFITPIVLGGPEDQMVANLVEYYARTTVDFRAASVLALTVTAAVSVLVFVYQRLPKEGQYGAN